MRCKDLEKRVNETDYSPSPEDIQHVRHCKRCMRRHGLRIMLPLHLQQETPDEKGLFPDGLTGLGVPHPAENDAVGDSFPTYEPSASIEDMAVTGELAFLSRLQTLGKEQAQPLERAQVLHQKVQKGDKLFWRGEYGEAASHYREALMVVRDDQGRVALQNKLARVQMHRQRTRDAISLLSGGLAELGEPSPPKRWVGLSAILELVSLWGLILFAWLQRKWPTVFPATVRYGDRSRAAQKLYRELAILSQGHDESVSQWAHMRELRWAVLLKQPLEIVVSFGRHAVFHAQKENHLLATWCCQKVLEAAQEGDAIAQASADFYVGRVAYLQGRWEEARERLERCVQLTQYTQDAYLKDAALQHLIRVYRNDGNFAEAVRVAGQLLSLYHKLGNLPRLSACCRHFALIYAAYGDFRQARNWSTKALEVALSDTTQSDDRALSLLRCYVLQGDLELRRGRSDSARRYIGEAIRLQREHQLSPAYLRDGMELLRKILGAEKRALRSSLARRFVRWCSYRWAILCGDLERAHHIRSKSRTRTSEHQVPQEMAYLFQESVGAERPGGIREAIPASTFAQNFLFGRVALRPVEPAAHQEADQIASMFPVGAVSSRWGRGALARDRTGTTTTQFSNASEAPWGYFFADDIG